ncbi:MAG: hypothetical protein AMJ93_06440 [Anaerolineae bacterium SM23_84]|nr:MAG: hypothetical protein AMJ93_06440 [Anaerolineae bacterium SM23_84]
MHNHTAPEEQLRVDHPRRGAASKTPVRLCAAAAVLLVLVATAWALRSSVVAEGTGAARGHVMTEQGIPAAGATVRQQTTANYTLAAEDGSFQLGRLAEGQPVTITAWLDGYYVGWQVVTPTISAVTVTLRPFPATDNEDYQWLSSTDPEGGISCLHCMVAFPEWGAGAHGQSAVNPRFFSMYNGTDIHDSATITPGYKLDFPGTAGNCATCHAPGAATRRQGAFTADMNELQPGAEQEGVFCEFCHKIGDVYLNPATGLPYPNAPGVLSYRLYRTYPGSVLFFGSLDDVTRRVSYLPLEKKSQFCAPCHQFSFWGTPIYQSFEEWLNSPYPEQGIECQTCHMPWDTTGYREVVPYFVYPEIAGSLTRDPQTLASHLDLGVKDPQFMQRTVSMTIQAQARSRTVDVTVTITNVFAGHHVPTDYPGRNMVLVVKAADAAGHALENLTGPVVPDWGGAGNAVNDFARHPGKGFAKVLRDATSGEWPVVNYWKPTFILSDNRIAAGASDISVYSFARPATGAAHVQAELWFRRLFIDQARAKGWETVDLLMARTETVVPASAFPHHILLPVIVRE